MKKFAVSVLLLFILPLFFCGCTAVEKRELEKNKSIFEERYSHYNDFIYIRDVISSLYATDEIVFKLVFLNEADEFGKIVNKEVGEYVPYIFSEIKISCSENRIKGYNITTEDKKHVKNFGIDFDENGNITNVYENKKLDDKFKTESAFKHFITTNDLNTEKAITLACSRKRVVSYNPQDYI